jgi:DNA-binding NarL/FixJ family response regulator
LKSKTSLFLAFHTKLAGQGPVSQRIRVLIADDQRSARQGLKALLAFAPQIEVIGEASNGQEIVELAAEKQPDVVLMDVQMPEMDGLEATRVIKSQWPQVKVIMLTMFPSRRPEALAVGADHFLLKGCSAESLQDAILSLSCIG